MRRSSILSGAAALVLASPAFAAPAPAPAALAAATPTPEQLAFYQEKIVPILSESCFKCHSEAEGKSKGNLVLDTREGLLKGGQDGAILTPGDPAKSSLMARVLSKDPDEKMPPKDAALTTAQIASLETWIKMGAPISTTATGKGSSAIAVKENSAARKHWAWQPVKLPAVPAVRNASWVKTPVDAFIAAAQEKANLTPGLQADRATLIRRAYFDLIGLPPLPWEVQAFINDKSPNAWEKVIDRLLASPRYGERWGRYWLDVARYSDTKGDNAKRETPLYVDAWTYRDYVVDAFNQDKPYDRFIMEQIAADRLNLGEDRRPLAALGFLTLGDRFNGNKNDIINDRIDVVTKGFLGLTVTCARCHDHMFDPIPQKDYYSLHGIFNSTAEPKENPVIGAQADAAQYQQYLEERNKATDEALEFVRSRTTKTRDVFRQHAGSLLMAARIAGQDRRKYIEEIGLETREVDDMAQFIKLANVPRGEGGMGKNRQRKLSILGPFFRFAQLPADKFAEQAAPLCEEIASGGSRRMVVNARIAAMFKGKQPQSLEDVAGYYNDFFKQIAAEVEAKAQAEKQGGTKPASAANGQNAPSTAEDDINAELYAAPFRTDWLEDAINNSEEIARSLPQRYGIRFQTQLAKVRQVEMTHPGAPKRANVVEDAARPTDSPVFIRGEAQNRGEVVPRRFLEILSGPERPEFHDGSGRLELAEAIASPTNPLTARVMVNRIWLHHFGEGLVGTPDDFGTMAGAPSHPELLDYLATKFVQNRWSVKAMHKLIMMSSVYQESSDTNPTFAKVDPNNRLLWRFNIRRLDFEAVRDSLLYIAGKLDLKMGGQPVNILSEPYSMRRSVYGYIDRRDLPDMMSHFDFASPNLPTGRRHETTVPQQALFMMNSPLMIEVSRKLLARSEMNAAHTDAQRIHALYWMIYQRPPKPEELQLGLQFLQEEASTPDEAVPTLTSAEIPANPGRKTRAQIQAERRLARQQQLGNKKNRGGVVLVNPGERVERTALSPMEKYTHALLMANETIYYN